MSKYTFSAIIFLICILGFISLAAAGGAVGYVHVDSWDTAPSDAYELHRGGRTVNSLYQDMPVQNGDYLIPLKKDCVILEYSSNDCSPVTVNEPTEVSCVRDDAQQGFWHSVYDRINFFSPRYELEETQGTTIRGETFDDDKIDRPDTAKSHDKEKW
ncbi:hypothetical protein [Maridesulfovibrio zosterae]|uniref:hypothetical protein n=1 Tax=Maridesulfovibrio zosterae TaxID=82171 RepID=UPI000404A126|nr:hypothetical protein [Maridesulfovibrio zosterae]